MYNVIIVRIDEDESLTFIVNTEQADDFITRASQLPSFDIEGTLEAEFDCRCVMPTVVDPFDIGMVIIGITHDTR